MSVELFAIVGAPLMLLATALFVVVVTGWSDRRDKARAEAAESGKLNG